MVWTEMMLTGSSSVKVDGTRQKERLMKTWWDDMKEYTESSVLSYCRCTDYKLDRENYGGNWQIVDHLDNSHFLQRGVVFV